MRRWLRNALFAVLEVAVFLAGGKTFGMTIESMLTFWTCGAHELPIEYNDTST